MRKEGRSRFHTKQLLYGGDYNPEQWLDRPDILAEDIRILKATGCNTVTLGVFSWSALEPEEGVYNFTWLSDIIDRLWQEGISVILATPSGARPKWLADRYPEVLRTDSERRRQLFGFRHNHCFTSPVYREKTAAIDRELSRRFGRHPAVILWHISNELGGECHCPLCQDAFRAWLKKRYSSIDELNRKWCTSFWSHTYSSLDQIESPSPLGETQLHALNLDWSRFVTDQTVSFMKNEIEAVRSASDLPVTTNMMYYFAGLDYFKVARELDITSWDTYPTWGKGPLSETARDNGLWHDMIRSLKRLPYLVMESCPSSTNWQRVSRLKRPGMLMAQALQGIAHGADSALFFQIRQSRGGAEKFHGALIDHYGGDDTRVLREAAMTGKVLARLACLSGTRVESQAAIVYDWDSIRAMEDSQGPRNEGLHYKECLLHFYHAFRQKGLNVDLVDETVSEEVLSSYRILALPMVYQFRDGFAEKLAAYTEAGGILITTFLSGIADETDLCWEGAVPHALTKVLGLRRTETDGLYDWEHNTLVRADDTKNSGISGMDGSVEVSVCEKDIGRDTGRNTGRDTERNTDNEFDSAYISGYKNMKKSGADKGYKCSFLCDLVKLQGARAVLSYRDDFYAGTPALTVNRYGKGQAWYVAAFAERSLYCDLVENIVEANKILLPVAGQIPPGLEITTRLGIENGQPVRYLIYQNFGTVPASLPLSEGPFEVILGDPGKLLDVPDAVVLRCIDGDVVNAENVNERIVNEDVSP